AAAGFAAGRVDGQDDQQHSAEARFNCGGCRGGSVFSMFQRCRLHYRAGAECRWWGGVELMENGSKRMNTSAEAVKLLEQALTTTRSAAGTIEDLIAPHDYQDVAMLISQAAAALLESASLLMQSQDEAALEA